MACSASLASVAYSRRTARSVFGRWKEALKDADFAVRCLKESKRPDAEVLRARVLHRMGRGEEAVIQLEHTLYDGQTEPDPVRPRLQFGYLNPAFVSSFGLRVWNLFWIWGFLGYWDLRCGASPFWSDT